MSVQYIMVPTVATAVSIPMAATIAPVTRAIALTTAERNAMVTCSKIYFASYINLKLCFELCGYAHGIVANDYVGLCKHKAIFFGWTLVR